MRKFNYEDLSYFDAEEEESKEAQDAMYKLVSASVPIKDKLDEQYMTAPEVMRVLGITKRQLFYWDHKGMKLSKKKTPIRSWRKFSIIDLFGFTTSKELLKIGLTMNQCLGVFKWLRYQICELPFFLYHFAEGDPIFLFLDLENKTVSHVYGSEIHSMDYLVQLVTNLNIVIPLDSILRAILAKSEKEDFYFKNIKDKFGQENRLVFYVDGTKIIFNLSEKEAECILQYEI